MKKISGSFLLILALLFIAGCNGKKSVKKEPQSVNDTVTAPDTGYTGITQYMSNKLMIKEVTFKNGVKEGLMRSFYPDGRVRQTFWYANDLREDSAKWYYESGQLFRSTPYHRDTIDGIQKQYYMNGRLKAKLGYKKGLRTLYFEEYTKEGKLVAGYPELVVNTRDEYLAKGIYRVSLELSDKSTKVKYFRGDITNDVFDTAHCQPINSIKGVGHLDLRKTGSPKSGSVGVIAQILTNFGNNYLVYKKIALPYNDLN